MSTRSSLALINWSEPKEIHLYYDGIDGCHYIETQEGKLKLPKDTAIRFANSLRDIETEQDKEFDKKYRIGVYHETKD